MPTNLTAVPQWVTAITPAGADLVSHANMATVLQTHADRQEHTHQHIGHRPSMKWQEFGIAGVLAAGVQEMGGALVLVHASTWSAVSKGCPEATTSSPLCLVNGDALLGPPTVTSARRMAYGGSGTASSIGCAFGDWEYNWSSGMVHGRYQFSSIVTARDIIWSEYGQRFIAVGDDGSGHGRLETRAHLSSTWVTNSSVNLSSGSYGRISCDSTGQYVRATPYNGTAMAISSDGGANFVNVTASWGTAVTVRGLAHDDSRALWVACCDLSGHADSVYTSEHGVSASWVEAIASPTAYGMLGNPIDYACDIATSGEEWLIAVKATSTDPGNVLRTADEGTSWDSLGAGLINAPFLNRCGRHLVLGSPTGVSAIALSAVL